MLTIANGRLNYSGSHGFFLVGRMKITQDYRIGELIVTANKININKEPAAIMPAPEKMFHSVHCGQLTGQRVYIAENRHKDLWQSERGNG